MEDTNFRAKFIDQAPIAHYYGDTVRTIFVATGLLMLVTMLFDRQLLTFNLIFGIGGVLVLTILAALTSPWKIGVLLVEAGVAALGFLFYEYFAIGAYVSNGRDLVDVVFILRQVLAVLFLIALYFSIKSIRGIQRRKGSEGKQEV